MFWSATRKTKSLVLMTGIFVAAAAVFAAPAADKETAPASATAKPASTAAKPTKEAAVQCLSGLLAAAYRHDDDALMALCQRPASVKPDEFKGMIKSSMYNDIARGLTAGGIRLLAERGRWYTFEDLMKFEATRHAASRTVRDFKVPLEACHALALGDEKMATFYWDGAKLKVMGFEDVLADNDPPQVCKDCVDNLKVLDVAIQAYCTQNNTETVPTMAQLVGNGYPEAAYLVTMPKCPAGGTYTMPKVPGVAPRCSVPGHCLLEGDVSEGEQRPTAPVFAISPPEATSAAKPGKTEAKPAKAAAVQCLRDVLAAAQKNDDDALMALCQRPVFVKSGVFKTFIKKEIIPGVARELTAQGIRMLEEKGAWSTLEDLTQLDSGLLMSCNARNKARDFVVPLEACYAFVVENEVKAVFCWNGAKLKVMEFKGILAGNDPQKRKICIANLKQLDAAIRAYCVDHNTETVPAMEQLVGDGTPMDGYLQAVPKCPAGGTYTMPQGPEGSPRCSVPGHCMEE